MSTTLYQVDAFTTVPFTGNPAGVCILNDPADPDWMQKVALEMSLSETAFLYREGDLFNLRWFTPWSEVDLCGHATLASAHVLHEKGIVESGYVVAFSTASGILRAEIDDQSVILDFPAEPAHDIEISDDLREIAQTQVVNAAANRLDHLLELESQVEVEKFSPDSAGIRRLGSRGLIVTAKSSDPRYDFVSRYFAPAFGIEEDPVTGSTHCCLGPYWAERLQKSTLQAAQLSKRGGSMEVRVGESRVFLSGSAVTVMELQLLA